MTPVKIFVPGVPQGKGRPRLGIVRGHAMAFTPAKTRSYEGVIATAAAAAMGERVPMTCPVLIDVLAVMPVPQSWPNWKREAALRGEVLPTTKPDMDNVEKAILDGFNEVVWRDDVQVVDCSKRKRYGEIPGVTVIVTPSAAMAAQDKRRAA